MKMISWKRIKPKIVKGSIKRYLGSGSLSSSESNQLQPPVNKADLFAVSLRGNLSKDNDSTSVTTDPATPLGSSGRDVKQPLSSSVTVPPATSSERQRKFTTQEVQRRRRASYPGGCEEINSTYLLSLEGGGGKEIKNPSRRGTLVTTKSWGKLDLDNILNEEYSEQGESRLSGRS